MPEWLAGSVGTSELASSANDILLFFCCDMMLSVDVWGSLNM
jgi:hypothetical protein